MTTIITIIISSSSVARCVEPPRRIFWFTRSTSFKHLHQTLQKRKKNRLQRFILIMVVRNWCAQCEDWHTFKSTTTVRMCSSRSWTTTVQVRKTTNNFQEIIRFGIFATPDWTKSYCGSGATLELFHGVVDPDAEAVLKVVIFVIVLSKQTNERNFKLRKSQTWDTTFCPFHSVNLVCSLTMSGQQQQKWTDWSYFTKQIYLAQFNLMILSVNFANGFTLSLSLCCLKKKNFFFLEWVKKITADRWKCWS